MMVVHRCFSQNYSCILGSTSYLCSRNMGIMSSIKTTRHIGNLQSVIHTTTEDPAGVLAIMRCKKWKIPLDAFTQTKNAHLVRDGRRPLDFPWMTLAVLRRARASSDSSSSLPLTSSCRYRVRQYICQLASMQACSVSEDLLLATGCGVAVHWSPLPNSILGNCLGDLEAVSALTLRSAILVCSFICVPCLPSRRRSS
jgi:hypothetical protein